MFEKILVAMDTSVHADGVLKAVVELANRSGSEVEVLHVRENFLAGRGGLESSEEESAAAKLVADAVAQLAGAGVKAVGAVRNVWGHGAAPEILKEAESISASIIVMGSNGTGELEGLLVGSTTHKVLHLGKLPVLVVR
jgi:nucleotide-binding universal stress UspA family protein